MLTLIGRKKMMIFIYCRKKNQLHGHRNLVHIHDYLIIYKKKKKKELIIINELEDFCIKLSSPIF